MIENKVPQRWLEGLTLLGASVPGLSSIIEPQSTVSARVSSGSEFTETWQQMAYRKGVLAIIDDRNTLWVVGNAFNSRLNVSELLRQKVKKVFLGEGQLILETKRKGWMLLAWSGRPQLPESQLRPYNFHNSAWKHILQAYFIDFKADEPRNWYFSSLRHLQNSTKLYKVSENKITTYPNVRVMTVSDPIKGLCLGKYHALCWTESGRLFSWGAKSLALGLAKYDKVYYQQPQQVAISEPVVEAYAGVSYSLALTKDGQIYEWGITSKEESVLTPRLLSITKGFRFVSISGFGYVGLGLTSANQLYMWGKGKEEIIKIGSGNGLLKIQKDQDSKIMTFLLEQKSLFVLSTCSKCLNPQQKNYFSDVMNRVKDMLRPAPGSLRSPRASPLYPAQRSHTRNGMRKNTCGESQFNSTKSGDYIDKLVREKETKQRYFKQAENQENLFRQIMDTERPDIRKLRSSSEDSFHEFKTPPQRAKPKRLHRKIASAKLTYSTSEDLAKSKMLLKQYDEDMKNQRRKDNQRRTMVISKNMMMSSSTGFWQNNKSGIKKVTSQTPEEVIARRKVRKSKEEPAAVLRKPLERITMGLRKMWLIGMLSEPLDFGRELLIKNIMGKIGVTKAGITMKYILFKNRAKKLICDLQISNPFQYIVLKRVVKRTVKLWRAKFMLKNRKKCVDGLIILNLQSKIKTALPKVWLASRKLQKLGKWCALSQKQRLNHLKVMWKKSLLQHLRPTSLFETRGGAAAQEARIKKEEFLIRNSDRILPDLKNYLQRSPVLGFRLKWKKPLRFYQDNYLNNCHFKMAESPLNNAKNTVVFDPSVEQQLDEREITSFAVTDILLYSQHHEYFIKPKQYHVNISDSMKHSEKWCQEENNILQSALKRVLVRRWSEFVWAQKQYERDLACFIMDNYDQLAQFRWKYLLNYNKLKQQNALQKPEKEQQLFRIMREIGAEHILLNDILPSKHKILEHAHSFKHCPTPPVLENSLSSAVFREEFRAYYERVAERAKYFRKFAS